MKKILIVLGSIMAGLFIVLSLADRSDYKVEKQLWRIQRQFDAIAADPKVVPARKFDSVAGKYQKLIHAYPRSPLVPKIYIQIAKIYVLREDWPLARENFQKALSAAPKTDTGGEALFGIGKTYEKEGRWTEAVETYREVMHGFPETEIGLNIPLYIAEYYLQQGSAPAYQEALQDAVDFYRTIARDQSKSSRQFAALGKLVLAYMALERWQEAVDTLSGILLDYASEEHLSVQRAGLIVKAINNVSIMKLGDYNRPVAVYEKFMEINPEHPLNPVLRDMIKALKQLEKREGLEQPVPGP
ncbi:MAG: tetratricopeptide repeat protein [Candidatus Omnitrophota bacterium]|nr:tetratricopeptide repeat protein [Candidatus Omnitrophota bacterium]